MTAPGDRWQPLAQRYVDHYQTLYGQVRTHVVHAHLRAHLPPPPAPVVDIGGGAGHQAIPLARDGYDVTIVDSSPEMLAHAAASLTDEPAGVAGRTKLVEAGAEDAPRILGDGGFAGVLCHGVIPYFDDPDPLVKALSRLATSGGIVSVVAKNAHALAVRPAQRKDWPATLAAFDARCQRNELGLETRGDTPEELSVLLVAHGVEPLDWYGVRLFTDDFGRFEGVVDPSDPVLAAELEASRRDPYRQLSRLFHLVGVRL